MYKNGKNWIAYLQPAVLQSKKCYIHTMNWRDHIVSDKQVLLGKPVIKGTRIAVEHVIGLLAQGWSEAQILENYPPAFK